MSQDLLVFYVRPPLTFWSLSLDTMVATIEFRVVF